MSDCGLKSTVAYQVVLRNGIAIDAEVPDYSELDTVPNERRYTADQPSAAPSDGPPLAPLEASQALPTCVPDNMPLSHHGSTSGTQTEAVAVSAKVGLLLLLSSASAAPGSESLWESVSTAMLAWLCTSDQIIPSRSKSAYNNALCTLWPILVCVACPARWQYRVLLLLLQATQDAHKSHMEVAVCLHPPESSSENISCVQKTQLSCVECKTACVIAALVTETDCADG